MNKKVVIGIIAGVLALIISITGLFFFARKGTFGLKLKKSADKAASSVSSVINPESKDKKSKNSNDDKTTSSGEETSSDAVSKSSDSDVSDAQYESKDTGKKDLEVKENVVSNGTVTVPIYAKNNPGINAAQLTCEYDVDLFDFADVTKGDMFENCEYNVNNGKVIIVVNDNEGLFDVSGEGILANVVLIPKNTPSGEYSLKVKGEFANIEGKLIDIKTATGKIVVK